MYNKKKEVIINPRLCTNLGRASSLVQIKMHVFVRLHIINTRHCKGFVVCILSESRSKLLPFSRFLAQAKLTEQLLKSFKYTVVKGKLDLKTPLANTGQQYCESEFRISQEASAFASCFK